MVHNWSFRYFCMQVSFFQKIDQFRLMFDTDYDLGVILDQYETNLNSPITFTGDQNRPNKQRHLEFLRLKIHAGYDSPFCVIFIQYTLKQLRYKTGAR
jgi:hypothetical protein